LPHWPNKPLRAVFRLRPHNKPLLGALLLADDTLGRWAHQMFGYGLELIVHCELHLRSSLRPSVIAQRFHLGLASSGSISVFFHGKLAQTGKLFKNTVTG
jgi:hypothetical protein